ncbi:MAG: SHOCT domain-containing protein [Planctomycetia bacterium]|nr:SHOCT domain-containing protein [Planctomycetia bacterium]
MYGDHGWFGFGGGFMWIFWILIIVAIIALFRGFSGSGSNANPSESPMEILRKRYASGEISDEEFERHRKELEK